MTPKVESKLTGKRGSKLTRKVELKLTGKGESILTGISYGATMLWAAIETA